MHRVHHVFQGVLVVAFPRRGTQEVAIFVAIGQLLRKVQLIRLLVGGDAKPQKNSAVRFLNAVAADALLTHQRTAVNRRDVFHFAVAGHFHAVIPAGDAIAQVPAHRQARAAVRAAVFQRLHLAVFIAPDHDLFAEAGNAHRSRLYFPARQHRIPQAA